MHASIQIFLRRVSHRFPEYFEEGAKAVEFGSLDINGSARAAFKEPAYYVGIDCHAGPGVDVVGICHEFETDEKDIDIVVSTEMLEHDPYWKKTLHKAADLIRPGGLLVFTCAGPSRPPHNHDDSPVAGYYENRSAQDVEDVLEEICDWDLLETSYDRGVQDLLVLARKAET